METLASVDVLVVGSGSAGSTAAIAAARGGARRCSSRSCPSSAARARPSSTPSTASTRRGGAAQGRRRHRRRGRRRPAHLGPVVERPNTYGAGTGVTYHPEHLKVVWETLVAEAGARVLLHAFVQDAIVRDGRVEGVVVATKAGLAARSRRRSSSMPRATPTSATSPGSAYELAGELEPAQTLTTTFRMANVDMDARRTIDRKAGFHALMAEAAESGGYDLPRREGSDHITPVAGHDRDDHDPPRLGPPRRRRPDRQRHRPRVPDRGRDRRPAPGARVRPLPRRSRARLRGRRAGRASAPGRRPRDAPRLRRLPADRARTSWPRAQFDDQIGLCGAPIEDHHGGHGHALAVPARRRARSGIPYRTLLVRDAANVLVAGRCFSATHDAHASVRSMAQCMAMGQAAGTAAALAVGARRRPARGPSIGCGVCGDGAILSLGPTAPIAVDAVRSRPPRPDRVTVRAHRPRRHRPARAGRDLRPRAPRHRWRTAGRAVARLPARRRRQGGRARSARRPRSGLRSVVDAMPCDCGPQRRASSPRLSGGAGSTSWPRPGSTTSATTPTTTGASACRSTSSPSGSSLDIADGIDANDYARAGHPRTPTPRRRHQDRRQRRRPVEPATCGSSRPPRSRTAATGVPILTHCEDGTGPSSRSGC